MAAPTLPVLRGRSSECAALDRLLDGGRDGHSGVLVIRGEAGVGKSALLGHVTRQARGFRLAQVEGVEAEMELPFAGLHQLCAPMLDHLDALPQHQRAALGIALGLEGGAAPDRFLVALGALGLLTAGAEEEPLLCVIDDAQWLDASTREVLGFAARRLAADPVVVVFAVRDPLPAPELAGLPELELTGLADDDAHALLSAVAPGPLDEGVRERIVAETRGNPLALLELPRAIAAGFALPDAGALPRELEEHYLRRVARLPDGTRRLLLLAAADPVGDAAVLWRAAGTLGIAPDAAGAAAREELLEVGARAHFRHPLVRSAVYRSAADADRRDAHAALAGATDDPDRRTWHRAHAATFPDDEVAGELVDRAAHAQGRGGVGATAAFLERASALTGDPATRAARALAAAQAKFAAGDSAAAVALLATADAGPLDELARAEGEHLRAQIAFDLERGRDAPPLLLASAQRLAPLDPQLARRTFMEALLASVYAGRLADAAPVAAAARAAPLDPPPRPSDQVLLTGLAIRLGEGHAAAAPVLAAALRGPLDEEAWLPVAYTLAAQDLLDDAAWLALASRQVEAARSTGRLRLLPYALDYLAGYHLHAGDLGTVERLVGEAEAFEPPGRARTLPYVRLQLAAWRGDGAAVSTLAKVLTAGAHARGEGAALAVADYATAILGNGLGQYERVVDAAERACAADDVSTVSWALGELVESASRAGRADLAERAAARLAERAEAGGTVWARGAAARARALVSGDEADHRAAVEHLERTGVAAHLARARLTYGEWLRREGRRTDAREPLRAAHDALAAMGAAGFADRARRELLATGEKVRKRRDDTRDDLTPQELHIARLARDGKTNTEIGAELFISARTVEWHLHKVFAKLDVTSRRGLPMALAQRDGTAPA